MRPRSILPIIVCALSAIAASAQAGQPEVAFPYLRHPAPGYYLIAPNATQTISLIDHAGRSVFTTPAHAPMNLQCTDSTLTYFEGSRGNFLRLNSRFQVIDSLGLSGGFILDFHEGHILSNGNYIVLGIEIRVMDLSTLVPGGQSQVQVHGAVFQERTFSGTTVFEWRSLDHIPVTDATDAIDLTQSSIDYIHVNSVVKDNDGHYLVSCRHTDEVIKVHGTSGTVMWRMGGEKSKGNQFTFIDDNVDGFTGFSHQHDASRTASGNIILFDNGALKPIQYSRAVEYEVNESLKTAKRVWSYRPTPDIYSASMGSVQELSNGNILVGYGTSTGTLIGQEVTRDGTLEMSMMSNIGASSYRLRKALFAMSGAERKVTSPGVVTFTNGDSTAHVAIHLSRVDAPTSIIAERHSYAPHAMTFAATPCVPMNLRWVVRASDPTALAGAMRFYIGSFGLTVPSLARLYHRATEGMGAFALLATTYDADAVSLNITDFKSGEYMIAYPMCYDPLPTLPTNNATNVSNSIQLRWTSAVQTGGYDVEVFKGASATGVPLRAFRTSRLDTTITVPEEGTLYSWRIRAVRPAPNTNGAWSTVFNFRTRLAASVALSPTSLPDSVAVQQNSTFNWTRVKGAGWYRVRIIAQGISAPVLDTLVVDTSMRVSGNLPWNQPMLWTARGEIDTSYGDWSNALFIITPPAPPRLLFPVPEAQNTIPEALTCSWSVADGAKLYHIRVYKGTATGNPWFEDTVTSTEIELTGMSSVTRYYWQVRSIGKYGSGPWSNAQWFMTRGQSILGISSLHSPVDEVDVDTLQATLTWGVVPEAMYYSVQLSSKSSFAQPDFDWNSLRTLSYPCPPLEAGKVYRWRVMAYSDVASGPWSDTATFTTMPGPDDALEPLTPISGSFDVPVRGNVTFITDPRFNEYRVEYALVPLFTSVEQTATVSSGVAPYSLAAQREYWWRVVGLKNGAAIDTGNTASFVTGIATPTSVAEITNTSVTLRISGTTLIVQGAEAQGSSTQASAGADLRIMDITGRTVHASVLSDPTYASIDLSDLSAGVYIAVLGRAALHAERYTFVLSHAH